MSLEPLRSECWEMAVHAEGTRTVFDSRAKYYSFITLIRDMVGLGLPVVAATYYSADVIAILEPYKKGVVFVLALFGGAQLLIVLASLIRRWDEEYAYCTRATSDAYNIKAEWTSAAKSPDAEIPLRVALLRARQQLLDQDDSKKRVSSEERQRGMRAGLIEFRRPCVCGEKPTSYKIPKNPTQRCVVCGGN